MLVILCLPGAALRPSSWVCRAFGLKAENATSSALPDDEIDDRINQLIRWLSQNTAKQVGLAEQKSCIEAGFDADITIWHPDKTFTVQSCNAIVLT
jgi:formylmethanofuran dehydrogenase subunit A